MIMSIPHELRHAWQDIHHPEWLDSYIHPEENKRLYEMQESEIDAEAFAIKFESIIVGIDFINSIAGLKLEPEYRSAIIRRMKEIDVVLSNKKIEAIWQVINLKAMLDSVSDVGEG